MLNRTKTITALLLAAALGIPTQLQAGFSGGFARGSSGSSIGGLMMDGSDKSTSKSGFGGHPFITVLTWYGKEEATISVNNIVAVLPITLCTGNLWSVHKTGCSKRPDIRTATGGRYIVKGSYKAFVEKLQEIKPQKP